MTEPLAYTPHERLSLKTHSDFNESWLHPPIKESPAKIGSVPIEKPSFLGTTRIASFYKLPLRKPALDFEERSLPQEVRNRLFGPL